MSQAFFKEFRMVGQICREGMDESGILPKARYAMTVGHCLEQQGVWECYYPPSGSRTELLWGSRGRSSNDPAVHSTKNVPKNYFLGTFLSVCCIQIERKNSFKLKNYVHGKYFNLMLSEHLEAHLMVTLSMDGIMN